MILHENWCSSFKILQNKNILVDLLMLLLLQNLERSYMILTSLTRADVACVVNSFMILNDHLSKIMQVNCFKCLMDLTRHISERILKIMQDLE